MPLLDIRLPVPEGRQYVKLRSRTLKVYLYCRVNTVGENGETVRKQICVGRIDRDTRTGEEYFVPNDRHFEIVGEPVPKDALEKRRELEEAQARARQAKAENRARILRQKYDASTTGFALAFQRAMEETGLKLLLRTQFGRLPAEELSAVVAFMAAGCPGTLRNFDHFAATRLAMDGSSGAWDLGRVEAMLDEKSIRSLFVEWNGMNRRSGVVLLDLPYLGVRGTHVPLRDQADGMPRLAFIATREGTPLYFHEYTKTPNSFGDFDEVLHNARILDISRNVTLLTDMPPEADVSILDMDGQMDAVIELSPWSSDYAHNKILSWLQNPEAAHKSIVRHGDEFRYERATVDLTRPMGLVLYKSSKAAADEEALLDEVYALRDRRDPDLSEEEREREREKLRLNKRLCGARALLCTREDITCGEAISMRLIKSMVHSAWDHLSGQVSQELKAMESSALKRAMLFLAFLGLIVRNHVHNRLAAFPAAQEIGLNGVFQNLYNMRGNFTRGVFRPLEELSTLQRLLASALGVRL